MKPFIATAIYEQRQEIFLLTKKRTADLKPAVLIYFYTVSFFLRTTTTAAQATAATAAAITM